MIKKKKLPLSEILWNKIRKLYNTLKRWLKKQLTRFYNFRSLVLTSVNIIWFALMSSKHESYSVSRVKRSVSRQIMFKVKKNFMVTTDESAAYIVQAPTSRTRVQAYPPPLELLVGCSLNPVWSFLRSHYHYVPRLCKLSGYKLNQISRLIYVVRHIPVILFLYSPVNSAWYFSVGNPEFHLIRQ